MKNVSVTTRIFVVLLLCLESIVSLSACSIEGQGQNAACNQSPNCNIMQIQNPSTSGADSESILTATPVPPVLPTPTATPVPHQPSPGTYWGTSYTGSRDALSYNGYVVTNSATTHFLIVDVTVTNRTSSTHRIGGWFFALYGSDNIKYPEDQSSHPSNGYYVGPKALFHQEMAFVVPNNVCTYALYFYDPSNVIYKQFIYITNQFCR